MKLLLKMSTSHRGVSIGALAAPLPTQLSTNAIGKTEQYMMAQVVESLSVMWKTVMEFQAPDCYRHLGKESLHKRALMFSVPLFVSLSFSTRWMDRWMDR